MVYVYAVPEQEFCIPPTYFLVVMHKSFIEGWYVLETLHTNYDFSRLQIESVCQHLIKF